MALVQHLMNRNEPRPVCRIAFEPIKSRDTSYHYLLRGLLLVTKFRGSDAEKALLDEEGIGFELLDDIQVVNAAKALDSEVESVVLVYVKKAGYIRQMSLCLREMLEMAPSVKMGYYANAFHDRRGVVVHSMEYKITDLWPTIDELKITDPQKMDFGVEALLDFKKYSFSSFKLHGISIYDMSIPAPFLVALFPDGMPIFISRRISTIEISYAEVWRDSLQALCVQKLLALPCGHPDRTRANIEALEYKAKHPAPETRHVVRNKYAEA